MKLSQLGSYLKLNFIAVQANYFCAKKWLETIFSSLFTNSVGALQKRLDGLNNLSYDERCFRLKIDRLELRRLRIDLITCFKILHGFISLSSGDFFRIVSNRSTRGNSYKLFYPTLVLTVENIFSLLELSTCGTVYQTKLCVLAI